MPRRYFFDVNYHRWDQAKKRTRRLVALFVVLVIVGGGLLAWDALRLANKEDVPSRPTKAIESVYDVPSNVFETKYFELETNTSWQFIKNVSGPNRFVYHSVRHKLVQGVLTVYVNEQPPAEHMLSTRLLPVTVGGDGLLRPDPSVTDHCNKTAPSKDKVGDQVVKLKTITFTCDNDATWYSVLIGLKGATPQMKLKRPDGTTAQYTIYYQDSTGRPLGSSLVEVIQKFKVR